MTSAEFKVGGKKHVRFDGEKCSTITNSTITQVEEGYSAVCRIAVECVARPLNSAFRFYNTFCSKLFP